MNTYILDAEGEPQPCDVLTWGRWFETHDRTVLKTDVGDVQISTVFMGVDHNFGPSGPPVLWETMIFGGPFDQDQWRYTSRLDALRGHARAVALVEGHLADPDVPDGA